MAKRTTLQQQLAAAIIATGGARVEHTRVAKMQVFTHPRFPEKFVYVGKAGALRVGKNRAQSIPMDNFKASLLASSPPNAE